MYNEELKKKYVNENFDKETTRAKIWANMVFFSELEDSCNEDINSISKDKIIEYINQRKSIEARSNYIKTTTILRYRDWCIENHYCDSEPISILIDDIRSVANKELFKETDIKSMCNKLYTPMHKFLIAGPFYGISHEQGYKELREIRRGDIKIFDENNAKIKTCFRELQLPTWVAQIAIDAIETYEYIQANGITVKMKGDGIIKVPEYKDNGLLYAESQIAKMYDRAIQKALNIKLNYQILRKSGIVYKTSLIMFMNDISKVNDVWEVEIFQEDVAKRYRISNKESFCKTFKTFLE